uniref:Uncharacterized protein n=1 Tax=Melanopsichium pennsylvanicum 4 TaxID=1398559 RepID=A0A077R9D4_9BASI|nr:uncharacterized protein BN887_06228 [Melanopsichium pennsylvanicum 4]
MPMRMELLRECCQPNQRKAIQIGDSCEASNGGANDDEEAEKTNDAAKRLVREDCSVGVYSQDAIGTLAFIDEIRRLMKRFLKGWRSIESYDEVDSQVSSVQGKASK